MNLPQIYVSCPIRGKNGSNATEEQMAVNCFLATQNLEFLEKTFSQIQWVMVAAHDRIVQKLLASKKVSIEDVLSADADLQKNCVGFISTEWEPSSGVDEEVCLARDLGQVMLCLEDVLSLELDVDRTRLDGFVSEVMRAHYGK